MAVIERQGFKYVTIELGEDSLSHIMSNKFPASFQPEWQEFSELRPITEKRIMVKFAGHIAEKKFSGRNNFIGSSQDTYSAVDLASCLIGDPKEVDAYLKWLWIRTANILLSDSNWSLVQKVAQELLKKVRLSSRSVRKLILIPLDSIKS